MDEKTELAELIDELVSKAGPTTGQIKLNQDPGKVSRLYALGWIPEVKNGKNSLAARVKELEDNQKEIQRILGEHHRRIDECSIQR